MNHRYQVGSEGRGARVAAALNSSESCSSLIWTLAIADFEMLFTGQMSDDWCHSAYARIAAELPQGGLRQAAAPGKRG